MKIVIAIDSFKGSLTSLEAGRAAGDGILRVFPDASLTVLPVADGGEGTAAALTGGMGGETVSVRVTGPLGEPVDASYGIIPHTATAVIEMASAAGLTLVQPKDRDPMRTTTYGVGEMIVHAIGRGCRNFIVGIGGSATNDGGVGMLQALGFSFTDKDKSPVPYGCAGVGLIHSIDVGTAMPELSECTFNIACDVKNPLCGDTGCSRIYAPQKGADAESIEVMDAYLEKFAAIAAEKFPHADKDLPGAGAAGGLGFAFHTFLGGVLSPGVDIVLRAVELERHLMDADLVITGEGRLDSQTAMGKAPAGVAAIAKKHGVPVIAVAGCVSDDAGICNLHGIDAFFPILRRIVTEAEAMDSACAYKNMADTVEQIIRIIKIYK